MTIFRKQQVTQLINGNQNDDNTQKIGKLPKNNGQNAYFPTLAIKNVLEIIRQNPKIKYDAIADKLGIEASTIRRSIAWLKENGYINKEHSKIKGVWQLLENAPTEII